MEKYMKNDFSVLFLYSRLRCLVHWIVTKKAFDMFIMFVIVLSSIALASEDPVSEKSERNKFLGYADYGFTAIFTLECCLKVCFKTLSILHPCSKIFVGREKVPNQSVCKVFDISIPKIVRGTSVKNTNKNFNSQRVLNSQKSQKFNRNYCNFEMMNI